MSEDEHVKKRVKSRIWNKMYYWVLLCVVIAFLLYQKDGGPRVLGGFSVFNVLTGSMQSEIPKDSMVITRKIDEATLKIGDDITFMVGPTTTITHRIVGIYEDYNDTGYRGFETKGLENINKDKDVILSPNIVGKVIYHNYHLGRILVFLQANWRAVAIYLASFILVRTILLKILNKKNANQVEQQEGCEKQVQPKDLEEEEQVLSTEEQVLTIEERDSNVEELLVEQLLEEIYKPSHEALFQKHLDELKDEKNKNRYWFKKLRGKKLRDKKPGGEG